MMLSCDSAQAPFQRITQLENDCKTTLHYNKQQHHEQLKHQTDYGNLQS
jgi:hypothetical protein